MRWRLHHLLFVKMLVICIKTSDSTLNITFPYKQFERTNPKKVIFYQERLCRGLKLLYEFLGAGQLFKADFAAVLKTLFICYFSSSHRSTYHNPCHLQTASPSLPKCCCQPPPCPCPALHAQCSPPHWY